MSVTCNRFNYEEDCSFLIVFFFKCTLSSAAFREGYLSLTVIYFLEIRKRTYQNTKVFKFRPGFMRTALLALNLWRKKPQTIGKFNLRGKWLNLSRV